MRLGSDSMEHLVDPPGADLVCGQASGTIAPETFLTRSLHPADQYDAWCEWVRPTFGIMPMDSVRYGFQAENHVWRLGDMAVSQVSAPPVRVKRQKADLRRDPVDHWVLSFCKQGATVITTDRASIKAPAGVPFLWSLGEASESERTQVDRTQLFLARDAFCDIAPLLDTERCSVLDTPLGRLLGDYMLALERRLPAMTRADLPRLTQATGAMIAAVVGPSAERIAVAKGPIDLGRLERVRQAVRKQLRSPALAPMTLCHVLGISRSNLYRLFEDVGGVARYIQSRRLHEAHAMLSQTATNHAISLIAEELCFPDASSFSRAFKREFGYSPSEARIAALGGLTQSAAPRAQAALEAARFSDLLRGL
jgi:AraC-like DNA-binding protein